MLSRYTREEMGKIWTSHNRFEKMLEVEKAVARVQAQCGLIPPSAAREIENKASFQLRNIAKNEQITRHDVNAFVQEVARQVGPGAGSYVHFGLTSSDVLDTALALQVRQAGQVLKKAVVRLKKALRDQSKKHAATLMVGRTHGQEAEPLTFGLKLSGYLLELCRNEARVFEALKQVEVMKLSGAVGAYHNLPPRVEKKLSSVLKLQVEPVATQVVPRDRHAELVLALGLMATGWERLAVEIRHLQRFEVAEVAEPFQKGQTGSSAMPHKKNPIYSENLTGLARLIRSYVHAAFDNVVLWHERDISHSSVERVMFPTVFILSDFALHRLAHLVENLEVRPLKMAENLHSCQGRESSSLLLTALVQKGVGRERAYSLLQKESFSSLRKGVSLKDQVLKNKQILKHLSRKEINRLFSAREKAKTLSGRVKKLLSSLKIEGSR